MGKSRPRILVVDDEPDAVEFVRTVLEEAGYEVASAGDGEAGLRAAHDQRPDLIILDVQMPGRDGFAVFAEMRGDDELKGVPVIMLTGVGEKVGISFSAQDLGEYLGTEPEAYVEKPVDPEELESTVRSILSL